MPARLARRTWRRCGHCRRGRESRPRASPITQMGRLPGRPVRLIGRRGSTLSGAAATSQVVELGEYLVLDCYSARKFGSVAISMLLVAYARQMPANGGSCGDRGCGAQGARLRSAARDVLLCAGTGCGEGVDRRACACLRLLRRASQSVLYDNDRCLVSRILADGTRRRARLSAGSCRITSCAIVTAPRQGERQGRGGGSGGLCPAQLHGAAAALCRLGSVQSAARGPSSAAARQGISARHRKTIGERLCGIWRPWPRRRRRFRLRPGSRVQDAVWSVTRPDYRWRWAMAARRH